MTIQTSCPHCGKSFHTRDEFIDRNARCTGCGQAFAIQPAATGRVPKVDEIAEEPSCLEALSQAAAAERAATPLPYSPPPLMRSPPPRRRYASNANGGDAGSVMRTIQALGRQKWLRKTVAIVGALALIFAIRATVRLTAMASRGERMPWATQHDSPDSAPGVASSGETQRPPVRAAGTPKPSAGTAGRPSSTYESTPAHEAKLKAIAARWKSTGQGSVSDLLSSLNGTGRQLENGVLILPTQRRYATSQRFSPPVAFRAIVLTDGKDLRLAHAADQIIFNWEMNQDEFRIDGKAASGRHKLGAGRLPANEWVGIEWAVMPNEMIIYVDGTERYRTQADLSAISEPFTIWCQNGTSLLKELTVVKLSE